MQQCSSHKSAVGVGHIQTTGVAQCSSAAGTSQSAVGVDHIQTTGWLCAAVQLAQVSRLLVWITGHCTQWKEGGETVVGLLF